MTGKKYKEVIFQWQYDEGEYKTEIRIVRDTKGEQDD